MRKVLCIAMLVMFSLAARAGIVVYTSQPTFVADTGALLQPVPLVPFSAATMTTTNGTITVAPVALNILLNFDGTYGHPIPGNDWVISGAESQDFFINAVGQPAYSFGFNIYKPSFPGLFATSGIPGCDSPCHQTSFQVDVFHGASLLGSFSFTPPFDQVAFYGFSSTSPFDHVALTEIPADIDDEFFANLYLGNQAPGVPEPGSLLLFSSGLMGAAGAIRRKLSR